MRPLSEAKCLPAVVEENSYKVVKIFLNSPSIAYINDCI